MFTGLVQDLGEVTRIDETADGVRIAVRTPLAAELSEGDSVAVNGVCLTAVEVVDRFLSFDAVPETLARTSLGRLEAGGRVNLEPAVRAVREEGFARIVAIEADPALLRYVVEKGSIAVDGISLTVSAVDETSFEVSLIPETLERTTLGAAEPGRPVNLEVDVLAKYVEKLIK